MKLKNGTIDHETIFLGKPKSLSQYSYQFCHFRVSFCWCISKISISMVVISKVFYLHTKVCSDILNNYKYMLLHELEISWKSTNKNINLFSLPKSHIIMSKIWLSFWDVCHHVNTLTHFTVHRRINTTGYIKSDRIQVW